MRFLPKLYFTTPSDHAPGKLVHDLAPGAKRGEALHGRRPDQVPGADDHLRTRVLAGEHVPKATTCTKAGHTRQHFRPQMLKWAWVQYVAILVVFVYVFRQIKAFVFSNQILPTRCSSAKQRQS